MSPSRGQPRGMGSTRWIVLAAIAVAVAPLARCAAEESAAARALPAGMEDYQRQIPGSDVQFDMAAIPGGEFLLGSPADEPDRDDSEGPQVRVRFEPFWIGRCEVTWAEYKQYMALADAFQTFDDRQLRQLEEKHDVDAVTAPSKLYDPSFTFEPGDDPRCPAVTMSHFAAKQYTKWLSLLTGEFYRLPTEAEWEYACRADSTTAYCFGDDAAELDEYAWHADNSDWKTHPVGGKRPNAWGLFDMHGNACEWVLDAHQPDWYEQLGPGPVAAADAVCWPKKLYPRVTRGGSWNLDPPDLRSAARRPSHDDWRALDPNSPRSPWWLASYDAQDVGFRIVRPLAPPPRDQWSTYWDADAESIQRDVDLRIDEEGKGERGRVDPELPAAVKTLREAG